MAQQHFTGGDGNSGQQGIDIINSLENNFNELYASFKIVNDSTYTFIDSDYKKTIIFTVNCLSAFPSGLRSDFACDVYAIPAVSLLEIQASDTLEVNSPYIVGGQAGSFFKRSSTIITGITGAAYNIQRGAVPSNVTTASSVAGDITGLSATLAASSRYKIKARLATNCDNTGGIKYGLIFPVGSVLKVTLFGTTSGVTAYNTEVITVAGLSSTSLNTNNFAGFVDIDGTITCGVGVSGTFKLQFASGTNTQISTIYSEGSTLEVIKI